MTSSASSFCLFFSRMMTTSVAVQAPRATRRSSIGPGALFDSRSESRATACPEGLAPTNFCSPIHFTVAVCIGRPPKRGGRIAEGGKKVGRSRGCRLAEEDGAARARGCGRTLRAESKVETDKIRRFPVKKYPHPGCFVQRVWNRLKAKALAFRSVQKSAQEFEKKELELLSRDRKSTRLNSSHPSISYAVFCLKKKNKTT